MGKDLVLIFKKNSAGNEALLDLVTCKPACFFGKLVSAQT
jgi:hypothetical protein